MHISDRVAQSLIEDGFVFKNGVYSKKMKIDPAGMFSDGTRVVMMTICERGRYLSRIDGWGTVIKDVDLREFPNKPNAAIAVVLS